MHESTEWKVRENVIVMPNSAAMEKDGCGINVIGQSGSQNGIQFIEITFFFLFCMNQQLKKVFG